MPKVKVAEQQFEVGDIVCVTGTIDQVRGTGDKVDIQFDEKENTVRVPTSALTLVERPDKFKRGLQYTVPGTLDIYMYLGEDKWYSYMNAIAYRTDQLSSSVLDRLQVLPG